MDTINKFPQQERSEQPDLLRDLPQQNRKQPQADPKKPLDQDCSLMVDSLRRKSLKASETDSAKESTANELTVKESTAKKLTAENRAAGKNDESKTTKPVIRLIHIGKKEEWNWEKNDLQRGYEDYSHSASEPSRIWIDLGKTTDRYNQLAQVMKTYHENHSKDDIIFYVPEDDLDLAPKIFQSIWGCKQETTEKQVINDSPWDIDTLLNYELQER